LGYRVVVVGATGNVGREMLNILAEREFPADEIAAVASPRSTGTEIEYGETVRLHRLGHRAVRRRLRPDQGICAQGRGGGLRGDRQLSSLYRMDPDVPLIVPEVNPDAIDGYPSEHHRQPQLLDRADGGRAEAAA
jgi:aspartate-semialdehyde dehydrogenase